MKLIARGAVTAVVVASLKLRASFTGDRFFTLPASLEADKDTHHAVSATNSLPLSMTAMRNEVAQVDGWPQQL